MIQKAYPRRRAVFNSEGILEQLRKQSKNYKNSFYLLIFQAILLAIHRVLRKCTYLISGLQDIVAEWKQNGSEHSLVILLDEAFTRGWNGTKNTALRRVYFFNSKI